DLIKKHA
ncbi:hypothetical protein MK338_10940, partial [Streptococcus vestibularis]|nr:hypothetical protein [Streptococcus vestibularis]